MKLAIAAITSSLLLTLSLPGGAAQDGLPVPVPSSPGPLSHDVCTSLVLTFACAEVSISASKESCQFFGEPSNVWHCIWRFSYSGRGWSPSGLPGKYELTGTAGGLTGSNALCNWLVSFNGCSGSGFVRSITIIPQGQTRTIFGSATSEACAPTVFFTEIALVTRCARTTHSTSITLP